MKINIRRFSSFMNNGKFDMEAFKRKFERTQVPAHQAFDR